MVPPRGATYEWMEGADPKGWDQGGWNTEHDGNGTRGMETDKNVEVRRYTWEENQRKQHGSTKPYERNNTSHVEVRNNDAKHAKEHQYYPEKQQVVPREEEQPEPQEDEPQEDEPQEDDPEEEEEEEEEEECPLCMEPLDITDKHIQFCQCGYRICLWCWHQIMENADRENVPGRCPACRAIYQQKDIEESLKNSRLKPEKMLEKAKKQKASQRHEKKGQQKDRKHLQNVRVVQKNLVYVIGLSMKDCREEVLRRNDMFGRFGKVAKVSVNRNGVYSSANNMTGPTGSAYVTFVRNEDAMRCIQCCDGATVDGKVIRCCYGTTKYCNAFLRHQQCTNPECLYLHGIESGNDSFTREEMLARYDTKTPNNVGTVPVTAPINSSVGNTTSVVGSRIVPPASPTTQPIQVPSTSMQQGMLHTWYGEGASAGGMSEPPYHIGAAVQVAPGMLHQQQTSETSLFAGEGSRQSPYLSSGMPASGSVQSTLQQLTGGGASAPNAAQSSAFQADQATWLGRAGASLPNPQAAAPKRTMTSLGTPGQVMPREQPALGLGAANEEHTDQFSHPTDAVRPAVYGGTSQPMGKGGEYPSASTSMYQQEGGQGLHFQSSAMGGYFSPPEVGHTRGGAGQMVDQGFGQGFFADVQSGIPKFERTRASEGYTAQNQAFPVEGTSQFSQSNGTATAQPPPGFETVRDEIGMIQNVFARPSRPKESRRSTSRFSFAEEGQVDEKSYAEVPASMDGDSFFRSFLPDANIKIVTQSAASGMQVPQVSRRPPPPGFGSTSREFEHPAPATSVYRGSGWNGDRVHGDDAERLERGVKNVTL